MEHTARRLSFSNIDDEYQPPVSKDGQGSAMQDDMADIYNVINEASKAISFDSLDFSEVEDEKTRLFVAEKMDACCKAFDGMQENLPAHRLDCQFQHTPQTADGPMNDFSEPHVNTLEDNIEGPSIISTRISLLRFTKMVKRFDANRMEAISAVGFGGLVKLAGCSVFKSLMYKLIDAFDTTRRVLNIGGREYHLTAGDFQNIMGVPEGGDNIVLQGHFNAISDLRNKFCTQLSDRVVIRVGNLEGQLNSTQDAGDDFIRRFVLFATATVLATTTNSDIKQTYLFPILDVEEIPSKNWASIFFKSMVNGIKKFKNTKRTRTCITGCALFLQVYYLKMVLQDGPIDCQRLQTIGISDHETQKNLVNMINNNEWCKKIMYGQRYMEQTVSDGIEGCDSIDRGGKFSKLFQTIESVTSDMKSLHGEIVLYLKGSMVELKKIRESHESMELVVKNLASESKTQIFSDGARNIASLEQTIKELNSSIQQSAKSWHDITSSGASKREYEYAEFGTIDLKNISHAKKEIDDPNVGAIHIHSLENEAADSIMNLKKENDELKVVKTEPLPKVLSDAVQDTRVKEPRSILKRTSTLSSKDHFGQISPNASSNRKTERHCMISGYPFDKTRELKDEDDVKLLMYALDDFLPPGDILSKTLRRHLTRHELRSLLPGAWLHQAVLDMASEALNYEEGQKNQGLDKWFFPVFDVERSMTTTDQCISYFKLLNIKNGFIRGGLIACNEIYVPLLTPNPNHFKLLIVDTLGHRVELMDSAPNATIVDEATVSSIEVLLAGMQEVYGSDVRENCLVDFTSYSIERKIGGPKQRNFNDCGLYVIQNMRSARNASNSLKFKNPTNEDEIEVLSQEIRVKVLLWILKHESNLLKLTMKDDAIDWFTSVKSKRRSVDASSIRHVQQQRQVKNGKGWKSLPIRKKHK